MRKRFLSIAIVIILTVAACLPLTACGSSGRIYIYVPDGPPLLAAARLFSETPEIEYSGGARPISYRLTTGQLIGSRLAGRHPDFALAPINLAAVNFNLTGDYIFGGVALWGMLHIVENVTLSEGNPVQSLEDLRGQVIYAYQPQMSPGIVLRTVLNAVDGLEVTEMNIGGTPNPNAVNIVFLADNASARDALLGDIAAVPNARFALLAEPVATALVQQERFERVFDMQKEWETLFGFNFPQVAVMVRRSLAESNPALVSAVIDMIAESVEHTRLNGAEAARIAVDEVNSAYLPNNRQLVTSFINGSGQDVFRFQRTAESRGAVTAFLEMLHGANPAFVGGRMPEDGFFF